MFEKEEFREELLGYFDEFKRVVTTEDNEWVVKGFIDVYKNIYTISIDTKVISKIIELMIFPSILQFASENNYKVLPAQHQNHYPDITFITEDNEKIAVDLKSTYYKNRTSVNGFTLGSFTGYFRNRSSTKNILFPYEEYSAHYVLGVVYRRTEQEVDEYKKYTIDDLRSISSVANDFTFLLQEKWKLATDKPGSGNTKNIGSVKKINELVNGLGPFSTRGEKVFDDYWMNYLTNDMARMLDSTPPYTNLREYDLWVQNLKD
ncbi:type II restriction endonuclease [uncultured Methanobrevibacter sp.]|uniref:type II restriction endonuclease n=1 Tax=uncultured Methanobrevibacter sp. TaxID=253161 RepID=UPI0026048F66|nr:type II restriction endonuclease [uncultured Methanobrevibacter sp.]